MKNIFIFTLLSLALLVSCNSSSKKADNEVSEIVESKEIIKKLKIELRFRTNKSDVFTLMMNNIEVDELQKKNIHFFEEVEPSTSDDYIKAEFDPGNISKNIIIHLGNKTEKEVTINGIMIDYGGKQFNLTNPKEFNKHLFFNKFIKRDSLSNKLLTKRVEGRLNPVIRLKNSFINQFISQ